MQRSEQSYSFTLRNLSEFVTTLTELNAIAPAANIILSKILLHLPAKSIEVSWAKTREYISNLIDTFSTHCLLYPESELHLEITHFDFAGISFCRFLCASKKAANI